MLSFFYKKINNKKGFTLVELIIVIAIIGILAAIAVPRFSNVAVAAKEKADIATAKTIADAVAVSIAEGNTNLPASGTTIPVKTADLYADGYLNSDPKPQAGSNANFVAEVTDKGTVSVYYGTDEDSKTGTAIYPK